MWWGASVGMGGFGGVVFVLGVVRPATPDGRWGASAPRFPRDGDGVVSMARESRYTVEKRQRCKFAGQKAAQPHMRMTCRWKNRAMHARDFDFFGSGFIAMAHRGGAQLPENLGKENTIAAFSHAMNRGITHLETDIQVTRDGHLVTMHDPVLARVTDDDHGVVAMLTLVELREATIDGEPIPTLDEVLDTFPDACFNIDMKAPGTVEPLVATLARHQAWDRVCVGSFNPRRLAAFRRLVNHPVATAVGPVGVMSSCLTHPRHTRHSGSSTRCRGVSRQDLVRSTSSHRRSFGPRTGLASWCRCGRSTIPARWNSSSRWAWTASSLIVPTSCSTSCVGVMWSECEGSPAMTGGSLP